MAVSLEQWKKMFLAAADLLLENAENLSRTDAVIGDGDHGITMTKIANLIKEKAAKDYIKAPDFFEDLGWGTVNVQGGSAGPLFGTFITGMQKAPDDAPAADVLECALKELQGMSNAKIGEKTMMDALIPAVEAMKNAESDEEALELGAKAAAKGAEDTADYIAKYGRAKNYGEKSIGVKDAGACSMALIFEGLRQGYYR